MKIHIIFCVSTLAVLISSANSQYGGGYGQQPYDFQGYGSSPDYGYGNSIPPSFLSSKLKSLKTLSKLGVGCEHSLAGKTAAIKSKCSEILKRQQLKTNLALQELSAQQFGGGFADQLYNQGQIYAQPGGISQAQLQGLSSPNLQAASVAGLQNAGLSGLSNALQGLLQAPSPASAGSTGLPGPVAFPSGQGQTYQSSQGLQAVLPPSQSPDLASYQGLQGQAAFPPSQSPDLASYQGLQGQAAFPGGPNPAYPSLPALQASAPFQGNFPGSPLQGVQAMQEFPDQSALRGLRGANIREIPNPGYPNFQGGAFPGDLSAFQSLPREQSGFPGAPQGQAYPGVLAGPSPSQFSPTGPSPFPGSPVELPPYFQGLPSIQSPFQISQAGPAFPGSPGGPAFPASAGGPTFQGLPGATYTPVFEAAQGSCPQDFRSVPYSPPQSAAYPSPQSPAYPSPQSPSCEAENFQIPFDLLCKMSSEPIGRDAKTPHRVINLGPNQTPDDASPQWGPQLPSGFPAQPSPQSDQCMANFPFDQFLQAGSQFSGPQSQGPISFPGTQGDDQGEAQQNQWG